MSDKWVIYYDRLYDCYCATTEANMKNQIQNQRLIYRFEEFTIEEIREYMLKYFKVRSEDIDIKGEYGIVSLDSVLAQENELRKLNEKRN